MRIDICRFSSGISAFSSRSGNPSSLSLVCEDTFECRLVDSPRIHRADLSSSLPSQDISAPFGAYEYETYTSCMPLTTERAQKPFAPTHAEWISFHLTKALASTSNGEKSLYKLPISCLLQVLFGLENHIRGIFDDAPGSQFMLNLFVL